MREVAIVGASAAGLYTAALLGRKGIPVRVFERTPRLEPAPRTLIVTGRMRDMLGPVGESAIVNEIRRFELFADGRVATVPLRRPDLIIERSELVRSLAKEAEATGARIVSGRRFVALRRAGEGFTLSFTGNGEHEERAGTVVGADGAFSRVARAAGWPRQPTVPLVQAIVRMPDDVSPDTSRVWFRPDDTPYFYWLIPESPERAALGVIGEEGPDTRRRLDRFMAERGLVPVEYQAARIPLYERWVPFHRKLGAADVYLVGDAAGQVKPSTVGGVVTGFRGAVAVAEAIASGRGERVARSLRRELDLHLFVRRAIHRYAQDDYVRLLDLIGGSSGRSLGMSSRDEAARMLARMVLSQPRVLLLAVRGMLTGTMPRRRGRSRLSDIR